MTDAVQTVGPGKQFESIATWAVQQSTLTQPMRVDVDTFDDDIATATLSISFGTTETNRILLNGVGAWDGKPNHLGGTGYLLRGAGANLVRDLCGYIDMYRIGLQGTSYAFSIIPVSDVSGTANLVDSCKIVSIAPVSSSLYCINNQDVSSAGATMIYRNCLVFAENIRAAANFQGVTNYQYTTLISNNIQSRGITGIAGTDSATNTVILNYTSQDFRNVTLGSNCGSGDISANAVGANGQTGVVLTDDVDFVSPSTGDFHVKSVASGGKLGYGNGIDIPGITTDIEGNPRSQFSIGAFNEAGGPPPVGVQEMYIKDGGIFVKYTPHVKVGGTFQEVDAYVLEAGSWVPVHEK